MDQWIREGKGRTGRLEGRGGVEERRGGLFNALHCASLVLLLM